MDEYTCTLNIARQNPERLLECNPREPHNARFLRHDLEEVAREKGLWKMGRGNELRGTVFLGGKVTLESRSLKLLGNVTSRLGKQACIASSESCLFVKRGRDSVLAVIP